VALLRTDVFLRSLLRLSVTANVVPSLPILVTLIMEAIYFTETSVLTRATRRHIPDDGISIVTAVKTSNLTKPRLDVNSDVRWHRADGRRMNCSITYDFQDPL
jgi:hypothetical protein